MTPQTSKSRLIVTVLAMLAALSVLGGNPVAAADSGPSAASAVTRRLSPEQYQNVIRDAFGPSIKIGGRFEPDIRVGGLLAVGSSQVSVTATGLEQYDAMARTISAQIVDPQHRATLIPCKPASETEPDDACASRFLGNAGRLLYRRPLTQQELQAHVDTAHATAKTTNSFYSGLALSLAGMLESPPFLFRKEVAERDPDNPGQYRLDGYSKASFLSFLLWNTMPDEELLNAAGKGELNNRSGLVHQVDRMLASPRLEAGVRAFFKDMLGFDEFSTLTKDKSLYPKFTAQIIPEAQEQTLRTIVDLLLTRHGDYRDIFTTPRTFLTPALAAIYKVPLVKTAPNGGPDDWWQAYDYPAGDSRSGILTELSFVSLHSHPGRSSATLRGKALRQVMLCQQVPNPPANVNFTVVQDTNNPLYKTARERVTAHRTDPVCAGCHKIMDPIGLALENFDADGSYRMTENGAQIDASGELDGVKFADAAGLGKATHDQSAATSCLVTRLYSYAEGRAPSKSETDWVKSLKESFASDGYKLPELLRRVAIGDPTYNVSAPEIGALENRAGE
jgi:hypothetical protein